MINKYKEIICSECSGNNSCKDLNGDILEEQIDVCIKSRRKDFDKWLSTLTELELDYFETEYRKEFNRHILTKIDYSEVDGWLFDKWLMGGLE